MSLNILIVDDSSTMRSMVARTLQISGLPIGELHQAANGAEALEKLESAWVDLVLVDINMPVMGGLELIERLHATPAFADLPVVVISTESSEARIQEVRGKGVQFIHKPFTPEQVAEVVGALVEGIEHAR
jgi:two-component system chemotaxis response regulator CheY